SFRKGGDIGGARAEASGGVAIAPGPIGEQHRGPPSQSGPISFLVSVYGGCITSPQVGHTIASRPRAARPTGANQYHAPVVESGYLSAPVGPPEETRPYGIAEHSGLRGAEAGI